MLRRVCALLVLLTGSRLRPGSGAAVGLAHRDRAASSSRWMRVAVCWRPGAVAIDGRDIVAVDTPAAIAQQFTSRADDRRDGQSRHARAHQYAHPCADGAVPRVGRRPRAHGLAAEVHLPGGSKDRQPGVRPRRHAPGRPRDDSVGDDDLSPTCTTSRKRSPRRRRKPGFAASWDRRSSSSRSPDAKTPADGHRARRHASSRSGRRTS